MESESFGITADLHLECCLKVYSDELQHRDKMLSESDLVFFTVKFEKVVKIGSFLMTADLYLECYIKVYLEGQYRTVAN